MACGCSDDSCSCVIQGANGIVVSGAGTVDNPYVVTAPTAWVVLTQEEYDALDPPDPDILYLITDA